MADSCVEWARQYLTDQEIGEVLEAWVRLRDEYSREEAFQALRGISPSGN